MNPDDPAFGPCYGLTIRQYYEIECLKGLLSSASTIKIYASIDMSTQALRVADALIRAQQSRDAQEKKS